MKFIADLHLHSHFSIATAKNLDLEHLYMAAQLKGVTLVGTGDFTHPGWIAELEEKLEPAEDGLFRLKKHIAEKIDKEIPLLCRGKVRFILQCEISSIYKKNDKVRKNHNLIYFPDIEIVKKFNSKLALIGNIKSDGRPILGLDAEKLLEIMLETSESGFLIPAHIWTPWFSMFGSKSGFDSIKECFGSLSHNIFAVETGLSSDPPMNWRVKELDNIRLISNSDAHSPMYVGRNASQFNTNLSFYDIRDALKTGSMDKYKGTIDMYPEEGKYHYDGHRKCNICLNPAQTLKEQLICPKCKKPLTIGVLYRVQQLASRPEGYIPKNRHGYKSLVPLTDILSEIFKVGPKTKKVAAYYNKALKTLGPELDILLKKNTSEIEKAGIPLLAEAITKMHKGEIKISPGYDGEYGKIKIFKTGEEARIRGEQDMFNIPLKFPEKKENFKENIKIEKKKILTPHKKKPQTNKKKENYKNNNPIISEKKEDILSTLNSNQKQVVFSKNRPILIKAGPGTGKTKTITSKIAYLINEKKINPDSILALTFTNKAAKEMKQRIENLSSKNHKSIMCSTFHSFCLMILKEYTSFKSTIVDDIARKEFLKQALNIAFYQKNKKDFSIKKLDQMLCFAKQNFLNPKDNLDHIAGKEKSMAFSKIWAIYQRILKIYNFVDFEDLIYMVLNLLKSDKKILFKIQNRFFYIFVDEYQDINKAQYLLTKLVAGNGKTLCVIGDPDQSIYGFRGSDNKYFKTFVKDYQNVEKIILNKNYRSTKTIIKACFQLINKISKNKINEKIFSDITGMERLLILETASEKSEAVKVGKTIEKLMGGISFFSMDTEKAHAHNSREFSFNDFAVLYRTKKQGIIFAEIFEKAGIPFQIADKENMILKSGIKELISLIRLTSGLGTIFDIEVIFDYMKIGIGKSTKEKLRHWFYNLDISLNNALTDLAEEHLSDFRKDIQKKILSANANLIQSRKKIIKANTRKSIEILAGEYGIIDTINKKENTKKIFQDLLYSAEKCSNLSEFLAAITMKKDIDTLMPYAEKVSLMTMHAAKGLEFPVVFITGCEQGLIPFSYSGKTQDNIEEERRLFYVAMTRAKQILYLTYTLKRRVFSNIKNSKKSPFLYDIEETLKQYSKNKYKKKKIVKNLNQQMELFN